MSDFHFEAIQEVTERTPIIKQITTLGGGCIHNAIHVRCENGDFFIKSNQGALDMFETEASGLQLLRDANAIGVPEVFGYGSINDTDYLCLEFIEKGRTDDLCWTRFGEQLAQLHQVDSKCFGLDHDNYIGRLPQYNAQNASWNDFFVQQRLLPQLNLANKSGLISLSIMNDFETLFEKISDLIPEERPALLHGDLWSGNIMCGKESQPFIFDPAAYFGHREAEIAFTKLFGGFSSTFYDTYLANFPLQPGHEERVDIFNLYPLLVHVNLFGQSYISGILQTLRRLV